MASTTTNYGFDVPTSSDLVKNGATQIALLGQDLDTFLFRPFTKNVIINGGMDIWQRGTSSATQGAYTTADRWWMNAASTTFSQETTLVPTGSRYSLKALTSGTTTVQFRQAIETMNAIGLAGKTVTLSGEYQASSTTTILTKLFYSTSVDVAPAGSWTEITATSGGSVSAINGSFTKSSSVFAVPSTAKSLMVLFDTGSVSTALSLYYANIQLEIGTQSSPFTRAGGTIQGELAACQRYYVSWNKSDIVNDGGIALGFAGSTTTARIYINLPVRMRTTPSTLDWTASGLSLNEITGGYTVSAIVFTGSVNNALTAAVTATVAGPITQYRPIFLNVQSSTSFGIGAEL
jgi:hypothetical protein